MDETMIMGLKERYLDWTRSALTDMRALVDDLPAHAASDDPHLPQIFGIAHNIKGMGGSFGFPQMSEFGQLLCLYLRHVECAPCDADKDLIDRQVLIMERFIEDVSLDRESDWLLPEQDALTHQLQKAGITLGDQCAH